MTTLKAEIVELVRQEGPIGIGRYMALALGHPRHGYYMTRDPLGAQGDFTTAPEISQMFGELIGLWAAEVWRQMGSPEPFALVELGPGRGTLMADMLRAAKAAPGFLQAVEVVLVETSPVLAEIQAEALARTGVIRRWVRSVDDALGGGALSPSPLSGEVGDVASPSENDPGSAADGAVRDDAPALPAIVIANEFFDALPIRQFVRVSGEWRERLVGLGSDGRLVFGLSPTPPRGLALPPAEDGAVRELCPQALEITSRIAAHLKTHGGAMLAVDYGYGAGCGDTLQAMKAHAFSHPLAAPGEADLTAHVDFAALARVATAARASPMRLIDQADLLERLGIEMRAEALSRAAPTGRDQIFAAADRLTDRSPRGMGALFKALAVCDSRLGAPPAFEPIPGAD